MEDIVRLLRFYADKYETKEFLDGDPSWFMHHVEGALNKEAMAFLASSVSYGNRKQFMPKILMIRDWAHGDIHNWILSGDFKHDIPDNDVCFYRLYKNKDMRRLLMAYNGLLLQYGSLGSYVKASAGTGVEAVKAITSYFAKHGAAVIIPKNTTSACKRICMFLRWMVRDNSPVDLGLWSEFIDKRTLVVPLDTHVLQQACRLGLLNSRTASMNAAKKLSDRLKEIFPDDPLKGDFALFGYGVNNK